MFSPVVILHWKLGSRRKVIRAKRLFDAGQPNPVQRLGFFPQFLLDADLLALFVFVGQVWTVTLNEGWWIRKVSWLPFVAPSVLSPDITLVGSGVPCRPYRLLDPFILGCSKSPTKSLSEGGFLCINSELPRCASWCQCNVWNREGEYNRTVNCQFMGSA